MDRNLRLELYLFADYEKTGLFIKFCMYFYSHRKELLKESQNPFEIPNTAFINFLHITRPSLQSIIDTHHLQ